LREFDSLLPAAGAKRWSLTIRCDARSSPGRFRWRWGYAGFALERRVDDDDEGQQKRDRRRSDADRAASSRSLSSSWRIAFFHVSSGAMARGFFDNAV
jgi:hypothetical protein